MASYTMSSSVYLLLALLPTATLFAKFRNAKIAENFLASNPIDLLRKRRPPGKTRPPSLSKFPTKACFFLAMRGGKRRQCFGHLFTALVVRYGGQREPQNASKLLTQGLSKPQSLALMIECALASDPTTGARPIDEPDRLRAPPLHRSARSRGNWRRRNLFR